MKDTTTSVTAMQEQVTGMHDRVTTLEKKTSDGLLFLPPGASAPSNTPTAHNDGSQPPRYHKLEFPSYEAKMILWDGCGVVSNSFGGKRETDQVWLASYRLTGIAQQWYFQLERDEGEPNWLNFKDYVNLHFGLSICHNPLGELKALHQTGTWRSTSSSF